MPLRRLLFLPVALLLASPVSPQDDAAEWVAVPPQSLEIAAGSPLDFSAMAPAGPPFGRGPVVPRGDRLVFADDGSPARFSCAMMQTSIRQKPEFPTHAEADAVAEQLRRHGYTLLRQQYVDFRLTRHAKFDLDIDPEQLDRFYYLLAALKRRGIAWMLDVVSGPGKGVRGEAWNPSSADDLRVRMHFDPAARALWLKLVDAVFARKNPYTGLTTLEDPALAFVSGANENSMAFARGARDPFPTGFDAYFDRWLRARYPGAAALAKAVPDLTAAERRGATIALPAGWTAQGLRMAQLLAFVSEREVDTNRWMSQRLAERGFYGPNLGGQDWNAAKNNATFAQMPVVDVHAYGGDVTSFLPESRFDLPSATRDAGLGLWLTNFGVRWLDRPIVATEYDSPFPGPQRYESGILFPALAAFQGYDMICRTMMTTVELDIPAPETKPLPIRAYSGGLDPSTRAQETLAAMLFFRGDVRPATRSIAGLFGEDRFARPGSAFLPSGTSKAALLARFGLVRPEAAAALPPATPRLRLDPAPEGWLARYKSRVLDIALDRPDQRIGKVVADLRADGTLGPNNRTNVAAGVYQSQTGEITVDQAKGRLAVVTPRTEAASTIGADRGIALGRVRIESLDAGALLGVTALDGAPIARSRKLLVVMTGETRNTGMKLSRVGDKYLFGGWGALPIRMRRVHAAVTLRRDRAAPGRLTVLSLRGTPLRQIEVRPEAGGLLRLPLDTAAVAGNPTTYFLVEFEN